jgi:hypothetical protein
MARDSSLSLGRTSPQRLRALLGLAGRSEKGSTSLTAQAAEPARLAQLLTEMAKEVGESGELLLETVATPDTPLEILRGIKELAKHLAERAPTDAHRDASTVLYHAAVAAAAGHHGVNVSSTPLGPRLVLYEDLAVALAGHPLGAVFREAICRDGVQD